MQTCQHIYWTFIRQQLPVWQIRSMLSFCLSQIYRQPSSSSSSHSKEKRHGQLSSWMAQNVQCVYISFFSVPVYELKTSWKMMQCIFMKFAFRDEGYASLSLPSSNTPHVALTPSQIFFLFNHIAQHSWTSRFITINLFIALYVLCFTQKMFYFKCWCTIRVNLIRCNKNEGEFPKFYDIEKGTEKIQEGKVADKAIV